MTPPRIMYLELNEDGSVGGSHRQLHDLVKFIDRSRFEPVVVFNQDNVYVERIRNLGCEVHVVEDIRDIERGVHASGNRVAKTLEVFKSIQRRRKLLKQLRIDLVHGNNSPRVAHDDWLPACRMLRIPIITSVMGGRKVEGLVHGFLSRSFDRVLPVSRFIESLLVDFGFARDRIVMIHHGIDLDQLRARVNRPVAEVRADLGVGEGDVLASMVGNIRPWKGQDVVVEGLGLLPQSVRERLKVRFAGAVREEDEPFAAGLRARVEELGLGDMIEFLGNRDDVPNIFNASDLAIHSSVVPEPGGIVVLEAMALGATVIAAKLGGHTEAMSERTGRLFDTNVPEELAEHLTELLADADLRRSMAVHAKEAIEDFSMHRHVERVCAVYDDVLT